MAQNQTLVDGFAISFQKREDRYEIPCRDGRCLAGWTCREGQCIQGAAEPVTGDDQKACAVEFWSRTLSIEGGQDCIQPSESIWNAMERKFDAVRIPGLCASYTAQAVYGGNEKCIFTASAVGAGPS